MNGGLRHVEPREYLHRAKETNSFITLLLFRRETNEYVTEIAPFYWYFQPLCNIHLGERRLRNKNSSLLFKAKDMKLHYLANRCHRLLLFASLQFPVGFYPEI